MNNILKIEYNDGLPSKSGRFLTKVLVKTSYFSSVSNKIETIATEVVCFSIFVVTGEAKYKWMHQLEHCGLPCCNMHKPLCKVIGWVEIG